MPSVTLSLLGLPRVVRADGSIVTFRLRKELAVLAYLAVEDLAAQPRDQLLGLLWPEASEQAARNNLRVALANLRHTLGPGVLSADRQTVQLTHDAVALDVATFQELLANSYAHHHSGNPLCDDCAARLKHALELYKGDFFHGFALSDAAPFEEWVLVQREALHQQALDALTMLAEYHERAREYPALCEYARRQLELEPWHEPAQRQLMRGLALAGDRDAALTQYARCCQVLAEELGIEPDVETRALYEQIRVGHLSPSMRTVAAPRYHLPAPLTPFIGREAELAALTTLCVQEAARLVTLVGAGGMGKTRLALELARASLDAYPDGVFFVALAPLHSAATLPSAIAQVIGLTLHGGDPTAALLRFLHDKHMLIVLDNFEHLRDGAGFVVDLLEAAPRAQILATSRERLKISGEHLFTVEGLPYIQDSVSLDVAVAPALRLLDQVARRADPHFHLSQQNLPQALRICQLVQGMPLGIELAAAWIELLPLHEIAEEVERSANFLQAQWVDLPERQRSMRAVFEWSWHLLNDDEQRLFSRLAVFRGSFTREAAEAVVGASLGTLVSLVHTSLVRRIDASPGRAARYEIHELLRQFADEHLAANPTDRADVAARHSSFYLAYVAQREVLLARQEPQQAAVEIRAEMDNIRQAWAWAARERRFDDLDRSAGGLWQFTFLTGLATEGESAFCMAVEQLGAAQQLAPGDTSESRQRLESKLLALYASALLSRSKYEQSATIAEQAVERGRASAGSEGQTIGLFVWGQALYWKGQRFQARARMEQALRLIEDWREHPGLTEAMRFVEWHAHVWLRGIFLSLGDYDAARRHGTQALHICQALGCRFGEVHSLCNLADVAREMRDLPAARENYERALSLLPCIGYRWAEAVVQFELGDVMRLLGDYERAHALIERGRAVARDMGDSLEEARATAYFGRLCASIGDDAQLREALAHVLQMADALDAPELRVEGLLLLTLLTQQTGDWEAALVYAERTYHLAHTFSSRYTQAHALVLLGHAQAALHSDAAETTYHQALATYAELGSNALVYEAHAGLAALALAKGARGEALALVEPIVQMIDTAPQVGLDEPFFVYKVCCGVLKDADDPRETKVLHAAQQMIQEYATRISHLRPQSTFYGT